jgi:photoactive yellow protein
MISFDTPDLARTVEQLSVDEVDQLPFGVIRLDASWTVVTYSKREAQLSGRDNRPTVGLDFFTAVAPCMNNPDFKGRIERAVAARTLDIEFTHIGDFSDRDRELLVRVQSASDGGIWMFLTRP